jgi:hypothetical protein
MVTKNFVIASEAKQSSFDRRAEVQRPTLDCRVACGSSQ